MAVSRTSERIEAVVIREWSYYKKVCKKVKAVLSFQVSEEPPKIRKEAPPWKKLPRFIPIGQHLCLNIWRIRYV